MTAGVQPSRARGNGPSWVASPPYESAHYGFSVRAARRRSTASSWAADAHGVVELGIRRRTAISQVVAALPGLQVRSFDISAPTVLAARANIAARGVADWYTVESNTTEPRHARRNIIAAHLERGKRGGFCCLNELSCGLVCTCKVDDQPPPPLPSPRRHLAVPDSAGSTAFLGRLRHLTSTQTRSYRVATAPGDAAAAATAAGRERPPRGRCRRRCCRCRRRRPHSPRLGRRRRGARPTWALLVVLPPPPCGGVEALAVGLCVLQGDSTSC